MSDSPASGGSGQSAGGAGSGGSGSSGGASGSGGLGAGGTAFGSSGGSTGKAGGAPGGGSGGQSTGTPGGGSGGQTSGTTGGGSGGQTSGSSGGSSTGSATGGAPSSGGTAGGTSPGSGGAPGTGGSTSGGGGPCDIYQDANTPCVAAHSTVRALYGSYSGNLYQVKNAGGTTKDIPVLSPGGFVDISVQDTFCSGTACTISIIYDQSPQHNDLVKSPAALWLPNGGNEAKATDGAVTVSGHTAHGIYVSGSSTNVAYRNNAAKGLATGDDPESMYMVVDGTRYSQWCCFDYGNAESDGKDDGNATMECLYFGNSTQYGSHGAGNGPWLLADLENGMYAGSLGSETSAVASNTSITGWAYVTNVLKGPSGNSFGLKAGNAESGTLQVKWSGDRPPGYSPQKKQGAIILGTGGDGSNNGVGTFFEGAITSGNPPDATDDLVQANIVAAGYGK
ncbi:MAG: arabinofuranosidase catalytic domain-containing protein [Polyangia bacterium]